MGISVKLTAYIAKLSHILAIYAVQLSDISITNFSYHFLKI